MLTEVQKTKLAEYQSRKNAQSSAKARLTALFDDGIYTELDAGAENGGSLTGVVTAYGFVDGSPIYAFSQDKDTKGGAVSSAQAAKICRLLELASRNGYPVAGIYDSTGAFIEEGASAIKAYSDILMMTNNLSGVVPQISVVCGVCSASAALIACSADFVITTDDASLYMYSSTDKNVSGTVSVCAKDDAEAIDTSRKLISTLPANNISSAPEFEYDSSVSSAEGNAAEIAAAVADTDTVIELYSDFGTASYTAIARIGGSAVGIVASNKTADKLSSDDASKLARFVRTCDAYSVPVVTFIDTEGFDKDVNIRDIAKLANAYAEATTLKISLVTGKAYGAAMVTFGTGNADVTYAYADSVISPIAPVTAVEFLMHDKLKGAKDLAAERNKLADEFADTNASAFDAAAKGCVTDIITSSETRAKIISALEVMSGKRMNKRLPKKHSNMPF